MKRKSPGYIKLQGQARNSADIVGLHDIKTASSLFMTKEERESLGSVMDFRALGLEARKEKDKFARQNAAVEKFQNNYSIARERLAGKINKNRAMMELRHELQVRRRRGESPDPEGGSTQEAKPPTGEGVFNGVELRY